VIGFEDSHKTNATKNFYQKVADKDFHDVLIQVDMMGPAASYTTNATVQTKLSSMSA
jgi:hypothetical protein